MPTAHPSDRDCQHKRTANNKRTTVRRKTAEGTQYMNQDYPSRQCSGKRCDHCLPRSHSSFLDCHVRSMRPKRKQGMSSDCRRNQLFAGRTRRQPFFDGVAPVQRGGSYHVCNDDECIHFAPQAHRPPHGLHYEYCACGWAELCRSRHDAVMRGNGVASLDEVRLSSTTKLTR